MTLCGMRCFARVRTNEINPVHHTAYLHYSNLQILVKGFLLDIIVKMAKISTFRQRVVGISNYADAVEQCIAGQRVVLRRDPNNAYDKNAIEVLAGGRRIGFISRDEAETLAPAMVKGDKVEAVIDQITGGTYSKPNIGILLKITLTPASIRY